MEVSYTGREKADNFIFVMLLPEIWYEIFLINSDRFEVFLEKLRQSSTLHPRKADTGNRGIPLLILNFGAGWR